MRIIYVLVGYLILPVVLIYFAMKAMRLPGYSRRWQERFGFYEDVAFTGGIWVHACSVGEVETSIPLIRELKHRYPNFPLLITTTTPTGSSRIIDEFGDTIQHVYLPFDFAFAVNAFLARFKPVLAIIVEKEIWPYLFLCCKCRDVPVVLVSAMLSKRSFDRYLNLQWLFKPVFQAISKVGAQNETVAMQLQQLGMHPNSISVTGNLKFHRTISRQQQQKALQIKQQLFGTRPIWIAASTHENEEALLLERLPELQAVIPNILLILAPRHPQRGKSIEQYCKSNAIPIISKSSGMVCPTNTSVFLLDSLGDLIDFFGTADIAFIGGSLVDMGCHNILEPAVWGIPVVFGPSVYNYEEISNDLIENNAAKQVDDADHCATMILELLLDDDLRQTIGLNGKEFVSLRQGQLNKTMEIIDSYLV